MRRIISVLLAAALLFSLSACAKKKTPNATPARDAIDAIDLEIKSDYGMYPEEALQILEAYVYAYTDDYVEIPQRKAEKALDALYDYIQATYRIESYIPD